MTIVATVVIWLAITLLPQESEHKLAWWREVFGYLERKRVVTAPPAARRRRIPRGSGPRRHPVNRPHRGPR
jgi:hypothetical protein